MAAWPLPIIRHSLGDRPRFAGVDAKPHPLAARLKAPELCQANPNASPPGRSRSQDGVVSLAYAGVHTEVKLANTRWKALRKLASARHGRKKKKERKISEAKRRQTQGFLFRASGHGRASVKREAHICRRSTAALARGTFHPKAQRQARLPGTRQERSVLDARPNRGAKTSRGYCGRYFGIKRTLASKKAFVRLLDLKFLQELRPRWRNFKSAARFAERPMPGAARERVASPPAGTAPAP